MSGSLINPTGCDTMTALLMEHNNLPRENLSVISLSPAPFMVDKNKSHHSEHHTTNITGKIVTACRERNSPEQQRNTTILKKGTGLHYHDY